MASSADARPAVIFFDCDDCLYKNDWKVANLLTAKIESFCSERLQMREGYAYELYKKWGTCLRGMQQEGILDDAMVEEYLEYSHDVPLHEHIGPDPELRRMLESLDPSIPRWVFTASTVPHATRCLELLGVADLFRGVIDVRAVEWVTKHDPVAYKRAMAIAGVGDVDPSRCLFLDDSVSNMRAAKGGGMANRIGGTTRQGLRIVHRVRTRRPRRRQDSPTARYHAGALRRGRRAGARGASLREGIRQTSNRVFVRCVK